MSDKTVLGRLAMLLLGFAVVPWVSANPIDPSEEYLLDLDLKDVSSRDAMWSLARILGADLAFDPLLDHLVSIELRQTTALAALDRVCEKITLVDPESRPCSWTIRAGEPPILSVGYKQLSLELVGADLHSVMFLFSQLIDAESLEVDPALQASVTLEIDSVFWFEALDATCEQAGCVWGLEGVPGRGARLVVRSNGQPATSDVSVRLEGGSSAGASPLPIDVSFALKTRDSGASAGTATFVGAENTFRISAAHGVAWEAVLSRVSLGSGGTVVVPFLLHCEEPWQATAFDPVSLPLQQVWMSGTQRARLELLPASRDEQPFASPAAATCAQWSKARVGVRILDLSGTQDPARGAMLTLAADEPGRVLQLSMPPTTDRPRTSVDTGVVVLERLSDGRLELGLVVLDPDGSPRMHRGSLAPGEKWDVGPLLRAPATFRIELAVLLAGVDSWPG